MYFYIDESGHTGTNLFDSLQPILYYGVISSKHNLDIHAEPILSELRTKLGVARLHATELGFGKLINISSDIIELQRIMDLTFDFYRVFKLDHAIISFFDQVFDQGLNPAVTWTGYWTPLRYALLIKVAYLFFDVDTLKKAWAARIEPNSINAEAALLDVCSILKNRVMWLPDERSRQIIYDALQWVEDNPSKIHYNVFKKKDIASVTPNIIGFQSVMHGIGLRIQNNKIKASKIVIDQQSQFNKAQKTLSEIYASSRHLKLANGPGLPEIDWSMMPDTPISFATGMDSAGLELVDIYLWIFKRFIENTDVPEEMKPIIAFQLNRGITNEISLKGIIERWTKWFESLPAPTDDQLIKAKEMIAIDEQRRLDAISKE